MERKIKNRSFHKWCRWFRTWPQSLRFVRREWWLDRRRMARICQPRNASSRKYNPFERKRRKYYNELSRSQRFSTDGHIYQDDQRPCSLRLPKNASQNYGQIPFQNLGRCVNGNNVELSKHMYLIIFYYSVFDFSADFVLQTIDFRNLTMVYSVIATINRKSRE